MATEKKAPIVAPPTDDQLAELKAKHPELGRVTHASGDYTLLFRRPTRAEAKYYRAQVNNPLSKPEAQEALARKCLVYPSFDTLDLVLDKYGLALDSQKVAKVFSEFLGTNTADEEGEG